MSTLRGRKVVLGPWSHRAAGVPWALLLIVALSPAIGHSAAHGAAHTVELDLEPLAVEQGRLVPGASDGLRVQVAVTGSFGQPAPGLFVAASWNQLGGLASPGNLTTDDEGRAEMLLDVPREQGQHELFVWTQDEAIGPPSGALLQKVPVGNARETVRLAVPSDLVLGPAKVRTTVGLLAEDPQGTIRIRLVPAPPAEGKDIANVAAGGRSNQEIAVRLAEPSGTYGIAAVWERPDGEAFISERVNVTWVKGEEPRGTPGPGSLLVMLTMAAAMAIAARRRSP